MAGEYTTIGAPDKEYCDAMTMSGSKVEGWGGHRQRNFPRCRRACDLHGAPHELRPHVGLPDRRRRWRARAPDRHRRAERQHRRSRPRRARRQPGCPAAEIRTGKLRGELSEGMLCSLGELGLEQRNDFPYAIEDGIFILEEDCLPGDDIRRSAVSTTASWSLRSRTTAPDCLFRARSRPRERLHVPTRP